jgi:hypothetical protein
MSRSPLGAVLVREARRLRRIGLSCRAASLLLSGHVSKSSVQRAAPGVMLRNPGRCPTCGAWVEGLGPGPLKLLCRACTPGPRLPRAA